MVKVYTKDGSAFHEPPYTEQERLRNINATLFKRGLPQVTSILEWEQRVNSPSNPEPPERPRGTPYTEEEILEGARRSNGGVVAFSSLRHPRKPVPAINKDNDKEPTRG